MGSNPRHDIYIYIYIIFIISAELIALWTKRTKRRETNWHRHMILWAMPRWHNSLTRSLKWQNKYRKTFSQCSRTWWQAGTTPSWRKLPDDHERTVPATKCSAPLAEWQEGQRAQEPKSSTQVRQWRGGLLTEVLDSSKHPICDVPLLLRHMHVAVSHNYIKVVQDITSPVKCFCVWTNVFPVILWSPQYCKRIRMCIYIYMWITILICHIAPKVRPHRSVDKFSIQSHVPMGTLLTYPAYQDCSTQFRISVGRP